MVREYYDKYKFIKNSRDNNEFNLIDISNISSNQIMLEDKEIIKSNKLFIYDTDLITTQIWSELYFGECPKWIIDESYRRQGDLYFLMDIDFDWVDDGTREFPDKRKWFFERTKKELEKRKLNYYIISGSIEERLNKCIGIIDFFICNIS